MDDHIILQFIKIIEIFNENEDKDIELRNKLINSLLNGKLYNNNKNLINQLNHGLLNCFQKFKNKFNTCEIFLNIINIYNNQENENSNNDMNIKAILNTMPINEFYELLNCIKDKKYLKNI